MLYSIEKYTKAVRSFKCYLHALYIKSTNSYSQAWFPLTAARGNQCTFFVKCNLDILSKTSYTTSALITHGIKHITHVCIFIQHAIYSRIDLHVTNTYTIDPFVIQCHCYILCGQCVRAARAVQAAGGRAGCPLTRGPEVWAQSHSHFKCQSVLGQDTEPWIAPVSKCISDVGSRKRSHIDAL